MPGERSAAARSAPRIAGGRGGISDQARLGEESVVAVGIGAVAVVSIAAVETEVAIAVVAAEIAAAIGGIKPHLF